MYMKHKLYIFISFTQLANTDTKNKNEQFTVYLQICKILNTTEGNVKINVLLIWIDTFASKIFTCIF